MNVTLVFPHQLFKEHPALDKSRQVVMVEEWLFFCQYKFHKQKLILHRASMQRYKQWLQENGYKVKYIESINDECDIRKLIKKLSENGVSEIHYADVADDWLERRTRKTANKLPVKLIKHRTPNFLNSPDDVKSFFDRAKRYFQTDFYIDQRKRRKILITPDGMPEGGRWTYDIENRKRIPKNEVLPQYSFPAENQFIAEAKKYVKKNFPHSYGSDDAPFENGWFATNFEDAEKWLDDFLQTRFMKFGVYQDAIVKDESILFHGVLTPMLNVGLLSPQQILDKAMEAAGKYEIPLNSLEGFVRQILGWREFMHIVYEREGRRQRTRNYWGFTRKIPETFWRGETGITPVDFIVKRVLERAYSHHIERLMVLGNFMLLCEFHPDEVYRWFMEMYADAYDWVMVPNVYGMSQFADGGLMATKPYISSSNYISKMSDFGAHKKTSNNGEVHWTDVWDSLFWRFMHVHRDFFEQNKRLSMLIKSFDKMPSEKRRNYLKVAEQFLDKLDNEN